MSTSSAASNLQTYQSEEVASHYATLDYLTPCEQLLFDAFIESGERVLDLGVGGGRTTPYLVERASEYVGIDYAEAMVEVCQNKFPAVKFQVADASNLREIPDAAFDVVVFSFNGIDYIVPDESRYACLEHVHRILAPGGRFIFSSHNPRAVYVRQGRNQERLRALARKFSAGSAWLASLGFAGLSSARFALAIAQSLWRSMARIRAGLTDRAFWHGEGNLMDSAHGGLLTHFWVPSKVIAELNDFGFRIERVLGDDYPLASHDYVTRWYYYVFAKQ